MSVDVLKSFQGDAETYRSIREHLSKEHKGKWIAVHDGKVVTVGDTQREVIKKAFGIIGDSPFYIHKVGEEARVGRRVYRSR